MGSSNFSRRGRRVGRAAACASLALFTTACITEQASTPVSPAPKAAGTTVSAPVPAPVPMPQPGAVAGSAASAPAPNAAPVGQPPAGGGDDVRFAAGRVAQLNGHTLQLEDAAQTVVSWTDQTAFTQLVSAAESDLSVGRCVQVRPVRPSGEPTEASASVTAESITISEPVNGGCGRGVGMPPGPGEFGAPGGPPPGGGPPPDGGPPLDAPDQQPPPGQGGPGQGGPGQGGPGQGGPGQGGPGQGGPGQGGPGQGGPGPGGPGPGGPGQAAGDRPFRGGRPGGFGGGLHGLVTAISGDSITVELRREGPRASDATAQPIDRTVTISSDTTWHRLAPAGADAVQVGQCATVVGHSSGDPTLTAVSISLRPAESDRCVGPGGGFGGQRQFRPGGPGGQGGGPGPGGGAGFNGGPPPGGGPGPGGGS